MSEAQRFVRGLRTARMWVLLGVLAPIGMLLVSGAMLVELRRDAWGKAEQTSQNLLQVVERDIERNFEIIDLSLKAVVENLRVPGVAAADPKLRQMMLFDRAATAKDIGVMLVLDEHGDSLYDAAGYPPRKVNNADRDYFKAHKAREDLGLLISHPLISKLTGVPIVVLSRRIDKPDGSFGGVALVSLKLSYFVRLFDRIGLGSDGAINLYLTDGTRIVRYPYAEADIGVNIAGTANFDRFAKESRGSFVGLSVRDGVQRNYTFTRVGDLPLILNVAMATHEIEGEWRVRAMVIGGVLFALAALTIGLSVLFGRELRRRATIEAELAALSRTDPLTGLANRRRFEEAFARDFDVARRNGRPLALLIVDVDHFKRHNDRHGHAAGDEILRGLAARLAASVYRPGDTVARVGGEEFAVLLPDTDARGASRIAERIHAEIARLAAGPVGPGGVTVSIGLAERDRDEPGGSSCEELYRLADAALYEAKAGGRNQTRRAASPQSAPARGGLRIVGPSGQ